MEVTSSDMFHCSSCLRCAELCLTTVSIFCSDILFFHHHHFPSAGQTCDKALQVPCPAFGDSAQAPAPAWHPGTGTCSPAQLFKVAEKTRTFFFFSLFLISPSKAELQEGLKRRFETHLFLLCSSSSSCSLSLAYTACALALQGFLSHKCVQPLLEMQTSSSLSLLKGSETEGRLSAIHKSLSPGRRPLGFGTVRALVMQDRSHRPQGSE